MPTAPAPFHILRNHSAALSALSINPSNTLLYSGDQEGNVGITDLSSRRVVRLWQAHQGSIMSVEEWNGHLIRQVYFSKLGEGGRLITKVVMDEIIKSECMSHSSFLVD